MAEIKKSVTPASFVAWADHGLPPPEGYDSFLAYAIAHLDTRSLALNHLFTDEPNKPSQEDFARAVSAEFSALCERAGIQTSKP